MPPEYLQCDFDSSLWKSASGFEHLFPPKDFPLYLVNGAETRDRGM